MALIYLLLLGAAVIAVVFLIVAIVRGWKSHSRGGRMRAITATVALIALAVGLPTVVAALVPKAPSVPQMAAPVPADSGLYFTHDHYGSGSRITLVRASARTGAVEWAHATSPLGGKITASGGIIYGANSWEAWALRGSDGKELWHTPFVIPRKADETPQYLYAQRPVIGDGEVYLSFMNNDNLRGAIIALRASDGKLLWSRAFDDYYSRVDTQPLAAGDGLVIVPSDSQGISAFHALDGSLAWHTKYTGYYVFLLGGVVYVNRQGDPPTVALDAHTGAFLWSLPCWQEDMIAFSGSGTRLYVTGLPLRGSGPVAVYAFDTQQRRLLWTYDAVNPNSAPIATPDLVFIAHGTVLDAVRASDGTRAWRQEAELSNAGPTDLALLDNTVYVRVRPIYPHVIIWGCGAYCQKSYSLSALRATDGVVYWRQYESPDTGSWLATD
jgi:outer membrane protein assembly factor BamB